MSEVCEGAPASAGPTPAPAPLSAAARARSERQRLRARALRDARLVGRPAAPAPLPAAALDSGGGFLLEPEAATEAPAVRHAPAPIVHAAEQPHCLACGKPFPQSYLYDAFDYSVCDACREPDGEHELVTRTEAKAEYLLQDCDLDARPPALRAERRRNPHRPGGADMRLYLRAQLRERALLVWGSAEALEEARARREDRRQRARGKLAERRVRALRRDVRSGLFVRGGGVGGARHEHAWGAERHDAAADSYTRACTQCGHEETYEKM